MPGKTQMDTRSNMVSRGGTGGGWGHQKRQGAGGGHTSRGGHRGGKHISGWGGQQKQREQLDGLGQPRGGWGASSSGNRDEWGNIGTTWDANPNDTASAWAEAPLYTAADGWDAPEPKIETMEDLLRSLALHSEDFKKDLIPFFLRSVVAAENEEPELKLESFLEEKIQARKASGWYWTGSDSGRKAGDGWSNHKASDNGWGAGGDNGWGVQNAGGGWGQGGEDVRRNDGWGTIQSHRPKSANNHQNQWHSREPHDKRHIMGMDK